jgi:hypothetical protein
MTVNAKLDSLDMLLAEKQFHLKVLRLWNLVDEVHGKEIREQVRSFGFRDEYLGKKERKENFPVRKYSGKTHHNCIRLKNDQLLEIPLVERPEPPGHMKVKVNEVS